MNYDPFSWSKQRLVDRRLLQHLYAEPHRVYHATDHPHLVYNYCEELWAKYGPPGRSETEFFRTTCAWHDAVYVVGSKTNEIDSAHQYTQSATYELQADSMRSRVVAAIEASANHWAAANEALPLESKVFLDADLYELSAGWPVFNENSRMVLEEYSCVFTCEQILAGRKAFFETILASPRIYWIATDREERARANLRRGIEELEKGTL